MTQRGGIPERVVSNVAAREGVSEEALPPLYESIEIDALESLFNHTTSMGGSELLITFSYAGYTVTIREPGDITIED